MHEGVWLIFFKQNDSYEKLEYIPNMAFVYA